MSDTSWECCHSTGRIDKTPVCNRNLAESRTFLYWYAVLPWPWEHLCSTHQEPGSSPGGHAPTVSLRQTGVSSGSTDSLPSCVVAVNMLLSSYEKDTYNSTARRQRPRSHCRYSRLLWGHERCRCYPYRLARTAQAYPDRHPTQAPNKERQFIPRLKRRGLPCPVYVNLEWWRPRHWHKTCAHLPGSC